MTKPMRLHTDLLLYKVGNNLLKTTGSTEVLKLGLPCQEREAKNNPKKELNSKDIHARNTKIAHERKRLQSRR